MQASAQFDIPQIPSNRDATMLVGLWEKEIETQKERMLVQLSTESEPMAVVQPLDISIHLFIHL